MKFVIGSLVAGCLTYSPTSNMVLAEENKKSTPELIERAKKIHALESSVDSNGKPDLVAIGRFAEDRDPAIRAIAMEFAGRFNGAESIAILKKAETDTVWFVRRSGRIGREVRRLAEKSVEDRWQYLEMLAKTNPEVVEPFALTYIMKGWAHDLDEIETKVPSSKRYTEHARARGQVARNLNKLSPVDRKRQAIGLLINWVTPVQHEQAVSVIGELGKAVVPDILKLLNNEENIPGVPGPPWKKVHANYSVMMEALRCIPDERAIPLLEQLAKRNEAFINEEARETLLWVKADVPYLLRYKKILMASEDDVPPGE